VSTDKIISPKIAEIRDDIAHRRAARKAHRDLAREIAQYTTADDRLELQTVLDRHSSEESAEIRQILVQLAS
jgi:hypothetical protein